MSRNVIKVLAVLFGIDGSSNRNQTRRSSNLLYIDKLE